LEVRDHLLARDLAADARVEVRDLDVGGARAAARGDEPRQPLAGHGVLGQEEEPALLRDAVQAGRHGDQAGAFGGDLFEQRLPRRSVAVEHGRDRIGQRPVSCQPSASRPLPRASFDGAGAAAILSSTARLENGLGATARPVVEAQPTRPASDPRTIHARIGSLYHAGARLPVTQRMRRRRRRTFLIRPGGRRACGRGRRTWA
jgi:hypothetical protein